MLAVIRVCMDRIIRKSDLDPFVTNSRGVAQNLSVSCLCVPFL